MRRVTACLALPLAVAFALLVFGNPFGAAQAKKLQALVVTGFDAGAHRWRETTDLTRKALEESGRFEVRVAEDAGIFASSTLAKYDVVLLNYGFWQEPELSAAARAGLLDYVKSGKGLVALHFASSAFQEWGDYVELLGRVWKKGVGGHGPRGKFQVKIDSAAHPITAGLKDFEADDELYAKLSGEAKIEVLASAHSEWSGKVEPLVFVKEFGKGRVVHNVLGHDLPARQHPSYVTLLVRGAEWAAAGKVESK